MTVQRPRLYLIDGSSYIFRAFFAVPPSSNCNGLPTNAILGFTNMLLKLLQRHNPEYVAVALDAGRETFRHRMFAAYKANRLAPPTALIPQFPYCRKVLDALDITLLELAGYEADDLVATLCKSLTAAECEIIVVSSDKDLTQLITDRVKLFDAGNERWIGVKEVHARFGVLPAQVIEVMGLMGDPVDNIPGVKGIGAKTAMALIQEFRTLENLYERLDEVEKLRLRGALRIKKMLADGRTAAFMGRELATVNTDAPIYVPLAELAARRPDLDKVRTLFTELGFTNLIKILEFAHAA